MTEQLSGQTGSPESPDEDLQVSQGPSGSLGSERSGGADAVPDTPDNNFTDDADAEQPERRGSALEGGE